MGEAKTKRRAHDEILKRYHHCIYCGHPASTIEHMPPRMMFWEKHRPKGLEFPCCEICNGATKLADLVASLLGRMWPDPTKNSRSEEVRKLLQAVSNNVPGLLEEMAIPPREVAAERAKIPGMPLGSGVLRANGPILSQQMRVFGAKLGMALHFEMHGERVPDSGGVQPMWFSNVQAARGELPLDLLNLLPERKTLRQGKFQVEDQFSYSVRLTEEREHTFSYAVFRGSFAIGSVTAVDASKFLERHAEKFPIVRPGEFRK